MTKIYRQNNILSSHYFLDLLCTFIVIYSAVGTLAVEVTSMSLREQKGRQIAEKAKITRKGNLWLVPSQSGRGAYKVDLEHERCTCPDYDFRGEKCKHVFAVQFVIEKTVYSYETVTKRGKTTTKETVE